MSVRTEKVASVVKRALAMPLNKLASEVSAGIVTITALRITNDLQIAKVYVSVFGGKISPAKFISILEERKGELRGVLGSSIKMRFTPDLRFFLDDTLDRMEYIQKLLDSVKKDSE